MKFYLVVAALALGLVGTVAALFSLERPGMVTAQLGFRGTGMEAVVNPRLVAANAPRHVAPPAIEAADPTGDRASSIYENVPLLGHLSIEQFGRVMQAMTEWIYPGEGETQGCNGCHVPGNFADESMYQKTVSRRMLQMVQMINVQQTAHVGATGVTCYTCHRGQAVPAEVWFETPNTATTALGGQAAGQNRPMPRTGQSSLPFDVFTPFLLGDAPIRVIDQVSRSAPTAASIQQTEWTYGLMMHMSTGLGANCTFCHNSRAFSDWEQSPPQRVVAWHGIRMTRVINAEYINPLQPVFPPHRLGPEGDPLKVNCATCHQGVNRPLNGAQMLRDYPELMPPTPERRADATPR